MSFVCRPVTVQDLPGVVALDHRCFEGLWNDNAYRREISSPNSDLLLIENAADKDRQATLGIGCSWAILEEAHITILGIDPDYRGQGLGQWLLAHLLTHACDRSLTHATLEVRPSNAAARSLYEKFGFQIAGERRRYYTDGENALILWRHHLQRKDFRAFLQAQITALAQPGQVPA